jgi:hypothetical protein
MDRNDPNYTPSREGVDLELLLREIQNLVLGVSSVFEDLVDNGSMHKVKRTTFAAVWEPQAALKDTFIRILDVLAIEAVAAGDFDKSLARIASAEIMTRDVRTVEDILRKYDEFVGKEASA